MILSLSNTWLIMKVTATTLPTPEATRGVGIGLYDFYRSAVTSVNLEKAGMASRNNVMFKKTIHVVLNQLCSSLWTSRSWY